MERSKRPKEATNIATILMHQEVRYFSNLEIMSKSNKYNYSQYNITYLLMLTTGFLCHNTPQAKENTTAAYKCKSWKDVLKGQIGLWRLIHEMNTGKTGTLQVYIRSNKVTCKCQSVEST